MGAERDGALSHTSQVRVSRVRAAEARLPKLVQNDFDAHLKDSLDHYRKARKGLDELATEGQGKKPIHPQYLARLLDELAAKDAIFSCDVGTPTIWAARYLRMNGQRRLLGSFIHGSMANALPQAIGAQVSHPDRQVIAMCGDGGLAMLMGDLLTLRQLRLPVKVIVFRNDSLAFVELEMKAAGILDFGTDLNNPSFAKIAEAAGFLGLTAETPDQVKPMIAQALEHDGPALAVVLAHEISHALAHHGAERLSRMELMQLGEAGLLAAVQAKSPGAVQMTGAALGLGAQIGVELPFSRQQESEADHIGLLLMAKAGYDPAKAIDFWQRMLDFSKGKEPPAFLSDHPSSEQRIADIKRELPEAKAAFVAHK